MEMDIKQIERLMAVMGRTGMKRIVLKQEGFEVELERETSEVCVPSGFAPAPYMAAMPQGAPSAPSYEAPAAAAGAGKKEEGGRFVTSPMVGTFYAAPSPQDAAFIKVGDEIKEESVVCIIEAMKVMNEVKAGIQGKVVEILVKNGDPVEFGTKIMRVV